MVHRNQTSLDNNSRKKKTFPVVANFIDWSKAFPRQYPKLGVESFINILLGHPLFKFWPVSFKTDKISVKWHGCKSSKRNLNCVGHVWSTLGLLKYLSQPKYSSDVVDPRERLKFLDVLSVLEKVNLLTVGMSYFNVKCLAPNDTPSDNQFIYPSS